MKIIQQTYKIKAPIKKVWEALTDSQTIEDWGGGPAKMLPTEGYRFSLWGADIFGKNTKVVVPTLLEQEWFGGKWDEASHVQFVLSEKNNTTIVKLTHTDFPEEEEKKLADGWKEYYMGPLKKLLES